MKHLRKSILTLLALTLFGGAGAWAQQGPTQVTEFTTDLIASWATDNSDITLADLQALGLVAVDASVAQAWTGAPTSGYALLVYGFNEGNLNYILFYNGNVIQPSQSVYTKAGFYNEVANVGVKFFYTGSPAIELTKAGDNQWTLGQTPDYDLELQVEYYQKYALKDIPAGWQILVNGQDSTSSIVGDSLLITETDAVTLVPDGNRRRVKSVTLADEGPATVLSGALVDGATIKVNFKWRMENSGDYVQGVYNAASGTFTVSKGGDDWALDNRAVYKVEKSGDNIIIGAGFSNYNDESMVWTFNTTNDTYTTTNGSSVNLHPDFYGLISVTLNGTDITSQLTAQ